MLYDISGLGKEVDAPGEKLTILGHVDLSVGEGDTVAILGASGSGKTTLLHMLGTLDTPSWGVVRFRENDLAALSLRARARMRNRDIGFVFQFHHLLPEFSTLENVAMPAMIAGTPRDQALAQARTALAHVLLEDRAHHRVTTLSGGERQRTAIARAVMRGPAVLLADEPTGNLDEKTGSRVSEMMMRLNRELGMAIVVVTHNRELAGLMNRRYELHSGGLHALD
jgi:lipoprotein-releasing system ATP-binding protein